MAWSSRNAPVRRYSRGYRKYRRDARRFPSSTYSTVRALRGTEESLAAYGASRALANDTASRSSNISIQQNSSRL